MGNEATQYHSHTLCRSWGFPVVIAREFSRPSRSSGDEQARYNEHQQVQTEVGKNKECQCMWCSKKNLTLLESLLCFL